MIEDIPLDTFDNNEAYYENDDLLNTGFSADDEQTYDSVTPGSKIDRQRQDLVKGKIRDLEKIQYFHSTNRLRIYSTESVQALWQRF